MPGAWGTVAWGLVLFVGLVSVWILASAAAAAPRPVAGGRLGFAPFAGSELPNVNGKVEVFVACSGSASNASCSGTVELSPRGPSTQRLTGSPTLASASITIPLNGERSVILSLSRRVREALTGHVLALTVTLRQRNRNPISRRMLAARERPVIGHSHPNHVVRHILGSASDISYNWEWDFGPHSYLILPEFTCPPNAPFVRSNGTKVEDRDDSNKVIRTISKADIVAVAKAGTGYAGFRVPKIRTTRDGGKELYQMFGWPEGSVFSNSVWSPLTESGHFNLTVTCASTYVAQVSVGLAFSDQVQRIFPWVD
jgi:hypothetical protein